MSIVKHGKFSRIQNSKRVSKHHEIKTKQSNQSKQMNSDYFEYSNKTVSITLFQSVALHVQASVYRAIEMFAYHLDSDDQVANKA